MPPFRVRIFALRTALLSKATFSIARSNQSKTTWTSGRRLASTREVHGTMNFSTGACKRVTVRIEELRSFIDRGTPVPLGLQGDGNTGNHQVVAVGYDMGRYRGDLGAFETDFKIFIYDPNHPHQTMT